MRSLGLLALLLMVLVLAWDSGFPLLFRAAFLLALGLALSPLWVWAHLSRIGGEVEVSPRQVPVGGEVEVRTQVRSRSLLPKPWLEVKVNSTLPGTPQSQVVALPGRGEAEGRFSIPCRQRGRFSIGPLSVSSRDPFGLCQRQLTFGQPSELLVYPATVALPPSFLASARVMGGDAPFLAPLGATLPVRGLRDYLPSDSYTRIHWPSSLRLGRLMSKELEPESAQEVWLVLDMEEGVQAGQGGESTEEYGVTLAASLARACGEAGRSVALTLQGEGEAQFLPPDRGTAQLWRILEALSVATARGRQPVGQVLSRVAQQRPGGTLMVITPSADPTWVASLMEAVGRGWRALVFLLEASSFDPGKPPLPLGFPPDGVPCYRIPKGRLWASLFQPE